MAFTVAHARIGRGRRKLSRLRAELDKARAEISHLEEEIRLKDLRMARVPARHRPYYRSVERLEILELRAARGWSRREAARWFLLEPATVAAWVKRLDEDGDTALI